MSYAFKSEQIKNIIEHWLYNPPNGYIGVNYGRNLAEILLRPMTEETANQIINWMKEDIPLFAPLSSDQLSIQSESFDYDKKRFYIKIGQILIPLVSPNTNNLQGDTFNANAQ